MCDSCGISVCRRLEAVEFVVVEIGHKMWTQNKRVVYKEA